MLRLGVDRLKIEKIVASASLEICFEHCVIFKAAKLDWCSAAAVTRKTERIVVARREPTLYNSKS